MTRHLFIMIMFLCRSLSMIGQTDSTREIALNFPIKTAGMSFGNSHRFNGLRINVADQNVIYVNGINITFWQTKHNNKAEISGLALGILPNGKDQTGIIVGLAGLI